MGNDGDHLLFDYAPPRFRWLRRAVFGVLYLVCLLLIWRGVLACKHAWASSRAMREVAVLGLPTLEEINARPGVADDQNAAVVYRKAFALFDENHTAFRNSNYDFPPGTARPVIWYYLAAGSDERYQPMFALVHDAGKLAEARWSDRIEPTELLHVYNNSRAVAAEVCDNAEYHHLLGNDRLALQRIDDSLRLVQAVRQDPRMVSQLVGLGLSALSQGAVGSMAAGLRVDDPVVAAQVRKLIADLEADERDLELSAFCSLGTETASVGAFTPQYYGKPWFTRSLGDSETSDTHRAIAAAARDWSKPARPPSGQAVRTTFPPSDVREPAVSFQYNARDVPIVPTLSPAELPQIFANGYERYRFAVRRHVTNSRLTRAMLAMRLYRHDQGAFPASIDQLVPLYLSAIPASPWDESKRVVFTVISAGRPDGGDRPMIYLDAFNNDNPPPDFDCTDFHFVRTAKDEGRQWRDVSVWPESAYKPADNDAVPTSLFGGPGIEYQPGFEASGLDPSEHSPSPDQNPQIPDEPW